MNLLHCLREGVAKCHSAHVHASLELEIAVVAPVSTPRILDYPVVKACLRARAVADCQDRMVDIASGVVAVGGCVNALRVVTEPVHDLKSDRNWSMQEHSVSKLFFVTLCDVDRPSPNFKGETARVNCAVAVLGKVGIGFLGGYATNIVDVFESM